MVLSLLCIPDEGTAWYVVHSIGVQSFNVYKAILPLFSYLA